MSDRFSLLTGKSRICLQDRGKGFTLIELLVVMAIIAILVALSLPALSFLSGRKFDAGVRQINAMLNLAREEARSKNTYTWVLFYPSTNSQQGAQLTVVVVGSQNETDPIAWGTYPNTVPDNTIEVLAHPITVPQIQLVAVGTFDAQISSLPSPTANSDNDLNSTIQVNMRVPNMGNVTFLKAIRYLPSGGAGNNDSTGEFVELDLQPVHGTSVDAKNVAVVRVDKATGSLQLYRP